MRVTSLPWAAVAAASLLISGVAPLAGQSLADIARAEETRRKEIKHPAKVYTNKDLVSVPPPAVPPRADGADTPGGGKPPAGKDEKAEADPAATDSATDARTNAAREGPKSPPRDQAYWSRRMQDLHMQLDRDQVLVDALQSRINGLTADFTARDDPAQRRVIFLDRQRALDELDRLKKSVVSDQKAIADLEEEARRASVPP